MVLNDFGARAIWLAVALLSVGSASWAETPADVAARAYAEVDPFIGTGADGHTFPGATTPFGMVQLSPDTLIADFKHSYATRRATATKTARSRASATPTSRARATRTSATCR